MRNQLGAGAKLRVIEFPTARVALEMLGIRLREEGALVVVKPPCQAFRAGILEVDDRILVAVKHSFVKELPGVMNQPEVVHLRLGIHPGLIQASEEGGRTSPVETMVVKANANSHKAE